MWKKVFLFLLTATILVLKFLPVSAAILYGDINRDGNINSTDLTILKRSLLKNTTIDNTIYADLNCDGEINSTDFTLLKRYLLRKLSEFPANSLRPDAVRVDDLMGASVQTITNRFGQPDRIDLSRYGFDWYIYNNDLTKYLQIGIKDGKTVGIYSNSLYYNLNENIGIGTSKSTVEEELGSPLSRIKKGNTNYRMDNNDEWKIYNIDDEYYTTVFYDIEGDISVTAFMLIDYDTEHSLEGYYGTPSEQLRRSYEMELLDITNALRARHGKEPLKWCEQMAAISRASSKDMVENDYFGFTDSNGLIFTEKMRNAGIKYSSASELIAKGPMDSMYVIESWMSSERSSIILGGYESVGIGIYMKDDGCVVYVFDFYNPSKY